MTIPSDKDLHELVHKVIQRTLRGEAPPRENAVSASPAKLSEPEPEIGRASAGKTIAIGADHGGYAMKEALKTFLEESGYAIIDCGTHSQESVDYPDFAGAVAKLVSQKKVWRGIMIDGAGIGSCMAANKFPRVRAALCYDHATAHNSREHNDANLLTLGAGLIGVHLARQIVETWLNTPFAGGRHARRVNKIIELDDRIKG